MKKLILLSLILVMVASATRADEGMWLLPYLKKMNITDMKAKGMKLSAEDIYSINNDALKDAIVIFGGGCTGEIVSKEGLLLTNHHCGYGSIQQHSSVKNDYLKNGFWAMNRQEEIPTPGLAVTFVRRIEDVTEKIVPFLTDDMTEAQIQAKLGELIKPITDAAVTPNGTQSAAVRAMFSGNQYFLFIMERYTDVRLVGAPPSAIGKFGGDTDNWMWPRHTGDFSVFRVYSAADGKPAAYSKDNVPYNSPVHLKISLKGVKPNDFAMIMGFPGRTQRYMTSYEIDRVLQLENPIRIFIRGERQDILLADMKASDKIRIQYASKYAGSSNYWKNSIGMSRGLVKLNVKAQKQELEKEFTSWVNGEPSRQTKYGNALPLIEQSVKESLKAKEITQYLSEAIFNGVEIAVMSSQAQSLLRKDSTKIDQSELAKMKSSSDQMYKNYSPSTDRKAAYRMVQIVLDSVDKKEYPSFCNTIMTQFGGSAKAYVDYVFDNSFFASQQKYEAFLASPTVEIAKNDPAVVLFKSTFATYSKYLPVIQSTNEKFSKGQKLFIAGLMKMQPDKKFYPDANSTLRLTYGQVLPYSPADGVIYNYYTTLSGVIAKEDPKNAYDFTVPEKLKELYKNKDFGQYAHNGDVPVCFLSNNDITGGNSGSPIMNGKGEMIGLAFDGNWEAMSGDIAFEPELQRTINVDIRYVLFIIDKYAGATHLINEMTIVK